MRRFAPSLNWTRTLAALAVAMLAARAPAEQVVLTKIMYFPARDLPEYVELANITATPIDISNWRLTGQVEFEFPAFNRTNGLASFLKPFERVVVSSADPAAVRAAYKVPAHVRIFGPWVGRLGKIGGKITLRDKNGLSQCSVKYSDRGNWHTAANGTGHCLVLRNSDTDIDDWRNWTVSNRPNIAPGADPFGSTEVPVANPEIVSQQSGTVLMDYEDAWRYWAVNRAVDAQWRTTNFNDAAWPQGVGMFGFSQSGKVPPPGIRTRVQFGLTTYYFRRKFVFTNDPARLNFVIDQIVDDGAVYYLNGQEVGRVGLPGGNILPTTAANRAVTDPAEEKSVITIPGSRIVRGTNVLAVEVHNQAANSPDLCFGMRMVLPNTTQLAQSAVTINEVHPGTSGKGFVEFYNDGNVPINLRGHYLSSLATHLTRHQIPGDLIVRPKAFATVDFAAAGLVPGPPVTVYLTAPDGKTVVNAVREFIPEGRSVGRKPAGSPAWFQFMEPTPAAPNVSQTGLARRLRLNEIQFDGPRKVDWIELFNPGRTNFPLTGLFMSSKPDFSDKVALKGEVPPNGARAFDAPFAVKQEEVTVFVHDREGVVLDARVFVVSKHGGNWQVMPDGGREWYVGEKPTKGATNNPARHTDIVINEIMFKPPSTQGKGEFVELFNRGKSTVSLSGWSLHGGINYKFPERQRLRPGEFLVVAADAAFMRAVHGPINVIGDFEGKLSNDGDLLRLEDAAGNLADEVDYKAGGEWPELARGGGSSLELRNPLMDNSLSSAWAPSNEAQKAQFKTYTHRATFQELNPMGDPADFRELHLYLAAAGHVVVQNVQLLKNGQPPNVLTNANRFSTNGSSATGWLWQGNHWASFMTNNGQLHIISEGRGDNRVNRVEIDAPGLTKGEPYEIRFEAKWVAGRPHLIAHTWDWSVAKNFLIEVPSQLGTPGKPNSRILPTPAAQLDELTHYPAIPRTNETVKVTAQVRSVLPLPKGAVTLAHRPAVLDDTAPWQSKVMTDDGSNGDEAAGDGIYTALLPEYRGEGQIVQFYVRAVAHGDATVLPRKGAEMPAMFLVDSRPVPRDLRVQRFVISPADLDRLSQGNTNKHLFRFPRLSNRYLNATFVSNERDIFYNARVHPAGSSFTRDVSLNRAKFKLPIDHTFRGRMKLTWDSNNPNTRLANYMLYLLGHPVAQVEFVRHVINNGNFEFREDSEVFNNDFLNRIFKDGAQGELYRTTYMFYYKDDNTGGPQRTAALNTNFGDDPNNYRIIWNKRTGEEEDNFNNLLHMLRTVGQNRFTEEEINRIFDLELTLKNWAVRGYSKDSDTFSMGTAHNCFFYRKSTDGRWMCLLWDADFAFGGFDPKSQEGFWGGNVNNLLDKPYIRRLFHYYLVEILENYTKNSPRIEAWMRAEEDSSSAYTIDMAAYRRFFDLREQFALQRMGDNYKVNFKVTSNNGQPMATASDTITLEGIAPYGIFKVIVDGQPKARLEWPAETRWRLSNVALAAGENTLVVRGVDQWGRILREERFVVKRETPAVTSNK
ncbi:MAG: hypothetical protein FJ386_02350 [Verrucomicrobia bacterium]|nr:hypothetical protein [Verrucomicrobiota bacterium]